MISPWPRQVVLVLPLLLLVELGQTLKLPVRTSTPLVSRARLATSSSISVSFLPAVGWSAASVSADSEMRTVSCLTSDDAVACRVSSGDRLAVASAVEGAGAWACAKTGCAMDKAATAAHAAPSLVSEKTGDFDMDWSYEGGRWGGARRGPALVAGPLG